MDILRRRIAEEFSNSSKIPLDESLRCVIKLHEHDYLKVVFNGHGFFLVPSSKCSPLRRPGTDEHRAGSLARQRGQRHIRRLPLFGRVPAEGASVRTDPAGGAQCLQPLL
jgi:hypothetical protein